MHLGLSLGLTGVRQQDSSPPAWSPLDLGSSLLAWWTADRADLITLSGSQVTDWLDIIANRNMTQGVSGARPLYSATSFNGSPGVTFDGIDDEVSVGAAPFPSSSAASEMWLLADQTALPADPVTRIAFAYGSGSASNNRRGIARAVSGGVNLAQARTGNGTTTLADVVADYSGRKVMRGVFSPTTTTVYLDGVAGPGTAIVPNTTVSSARTRIGANSGTTPANFFQGVVRDAIITGPLSAPDAASLNTYLMNKRNP